MDTSNDDSESKANDRTEEEEEEKYNSSGICFCGPVYDRDRHQKRNQILRVTRFTTDMPFLAAIACYFIFMFMVWSFAAHKEQYHHLANGMDWRGRACGVGELSTLPKQAWINPLISDIWTGAICVDDCPTPLNDELDTTTVYCVCNEKYWPSKFDPSGADYRDELKTECTSEHDGQLPAETQGYFYRTVQDGHPLAELAKTGSSGGVDQPCAFLYRTTWSMHKCVPWVSSANLQGIVSQQTPTNVTTDYVSEWLEETNSIFATFVIDVVDSCHILGFCLALAAVMALIAMVCLKYCPAVISYGVLVTVLVLLIMASVASFLEYEYYRDRVDTVPQLSTHNMDQISMYVFLGTFVTGTALCLLHACIAIYMNDAVPVALSIFSISMDCFTEASQLLLYPVVHVLAFTALLVFWLLGAIMLYSAGTVETADNGVAYMDHIPFVRGSAFPYFFGLIWVSGFMNAMGYMIVAATVYLTTFAREKNMVNKKEGKDVAPSVMTAASCIMIRFHMGTAALGSLCLTFMWLVRMFISLFADISRSESTLVKFACCCTQSCGWCFDNVTKYLNKMAYLQTVLHGSSFCHAAYDNLDCVMKGKNNITPTTRISSYVLVLIKVSISIAATGFANLAINSGSFGVTKEELTFDWVPYFLTFCSSYVISTAFFLILEVAIDALMVAYCEACHEIKHFEDNEKWGIRHTGAIKPRQLSDDLMTHMRTHGGHTDEIKPLMQPQ